MSTQLYPFLKLFTKVSVAGGAVYIAYDSGLLGGSKEGYDALSKTKAAVSPALHEWMKYFGFKLPAPPKLEFSPTKAWNAGVQKTIMALSVAPSRVCEYSGRGFQYLKNLSK